MAEDAPDKDERTEPASEKKLDDARKKGSVAKSQDLNSAVMLLFGFFILMVMGGTAVEQMSAVLRRTLSEAPLMSIDRGSVGELFAGAMKDLGIILVPILALFLAVGFTSNVAQVGLKFSMEALAPKWHRLNPLSGIKKVMLSSHSAVELIKGVFKTIVLGWVAYSVIDDMVAEAVMLVDSDVRSIAGFLVSTTSEVVIKVGMAYAVIAAADYFYQKFEFAKNMRMTKQEVKDEYRMNEGDPQVKGRIKTIQRQIAYKRMMADVPAANVVVTNPTHFAVALKYESGKMAAPKVVAKGADLIALKIKEIAKAHHVPIVEDKPLARALYAAVDVGEDIPEKLFQAVAQILAYIYRLKRTMSSTY
ncbi:MAG: flagellar biosynthesis protein FlhB [Bacteroidetes bacterium]|nr:flagellar biosynthesis protein FlhB [Bacteroidota bacterium]